MLYLHALVLSGLNVIAWGQKTLHCVALINEAEFSKLRGQAWQPLRFSPVTGAQKVLYKKYKDPGGAVVELYAHYLNGKLIISDEAIENVVTNYNILGTWRHPKTQQVWILVGFWRGLLYSEAISGYELLYPKGADEYGSISIQYRDYHPYRNPSPQFPTIYLSPDHNYLLIIEKPNGYLWERACMNMPRLIDISSRTPFEFKWQKQEDLPCKPITMENEDKETADKREKLTGVFMFSTLAPANDSNDEIYLLECVVNAVYDINKAYIGAIILSMELDFIRGYNAYPDDKKVKIPLKVVLKWD
jgi:hypothetical protein